MVAVSVKKSIRPIVDVLFCFFAILVAVAGYNHTILLFAGVQRQVYQRGLRF